MQFDFWASRNGYTIGLQESSLMDLDFAEWKYLTQKTIDLFNSCKADDDEWTELAIGEQSVTVAVDGLPQFIACMIDLSNEEIPEDFGDFDCLYRCLLLDLPEGIEDGE